MVRRVCHCQSVTAEPRARSCGIAMNGELRIDDPRFDSSIRLAPISMKRWRGFQKGQRNEHPRVYSSGVALQRERQPPSSPVRPRGAGRNRHHPSTRRKGFQGPHGLHQRLSGSTPGKEQRTVPAGVFRPLRGSRSEHTGKSVQRLSVERRHLLLGRSVQCQPVQSSWCLSLGGQSNAAVID
jgi:hypothetical protein